MSRSNNTTLVTRALKRLNYLTREEAQSSIFEYIEVFYNKVRRHLFLGYQLPLNYKSDYYDKT